jgi:hypothetical protein
MLRPSSLPHALVALAAGAATLVMSVGLTGAAGVGVLEPASAHAAAPDPDQPLVPRIRSISPDYVPDKGPIVIRGTLTNASDQTWTSINVHGFMGDSAMTTASELSAAVQTPVDADVGSRIAEPGTFDSIASLAPGESTPFTVRLPRSTLPVSSPGVYWFGVHVLGDNGQGGPRLAVGRDRTFIPYVPRDAIPPTARCSTPTPGEAASGQVRSMRPCGQPRPLRTGLSPGSSTPRCPTSYVGSRTGTPPAP